MKRLLHAATFILGMSLFGLGISIMSSSEATPAPSLLTAQPIPPEPSTTTTLVEPVTSTSIAVTSQPKRVTSHSVQIGTAVSIVRQSTTTTTESPKTPLEIAQSQVGKTGPYAEAGFWCAKFVSYVAEQAKVEGFEPSDSPARLHTIANDQGRLTDTPLPGYLVFIDLEGENDVNDYITHVGIVESVDGNTVRTIEGNADGSGLVTRQTREIGDGGVIDFAPFGKEAQ
jgi:CHAP domain